MSQDFDPFLKQQTFMQGLNDEEIAQLEKLIKKQEFEVNDVIIEEGDHSSDLYLILEGEVSILKWDDEHRFQLPLGKLEKGEIFGEMSFMDFSPRSSSIKAIKHTIAGALSRSLIQDYSDLYNKIVSNIAIININRLRKSNQAQIKNLRKAVHQLQWRNDIGLFIFIFLIGLGLIQMLTLALFAPYFNQLGFVSPFSNHMSWLLLLFPTALLIHFFPLEYSELGLTKKNGGRALLEAGLTIVGGGISLLLGKWFYSHFLSTASLTSSLSLSFIGGYLVYSCAREFLSRGVLQSSIAKFLNDETGFQTVFLTALLLNIFSFPFHFPASLCFFIADILLGSLYFHQKTLIGVVLVHFILGLLVFQQGIMDFY